MIKIGDKVRFTDGRKEQGFSSCPEWAVESEGIIVRNYDDGYIKVEFTSKNGEKYLQEWSVESFGLEE
jgi:hypothetical protein